MTANIGVIAVSIASAFRAAFGLCCQGALLLCVANCAPAFAQPVGERLSLTPIVEQWEWHEDEIVTVMHIEFRCARVIEAVFSVLPASIGNSAGTSLISFQMGAYRGPNPPNRENQRRDFGDFLQIEMLRDVDSCDGTLRSLEIDGKVNLEAIRARPGAYAGFRRAIQVTKDSFRITSFTPQPCGWARQAVRPADSYLIKRTPRFFGSAPIATDRGTFWFIEYGSTDGTRGSAAAVTVEKQSCKSSSTDPLQSR